MKRFWIYFVALSMSLPSNAYPFTLTTAPQVFTSYEEVGDCPTVFTTVDPDEDQLIYVKTTQDNCYIDPITGRMVCPQNAPRLINPVFSAQAAANCPTCPQVQVQQPRVIRTYRQGHWTFPSYGTSSVYMHLMQDHGVDPTGLTEDQARELHDQLHEGVAGRTATFSMTTTTTTTFSNAPATTANNPSGYFGSNGYQGRMFDGQGWYPGKGLRTVVDILTPGFGPRARARRMRRGR